MSNQRLSSPTRASDDVRPRPTVARLDLAGAGTSLSQFIIKVNSRCNIACDYCYVYEHADQGWRRQPRAISLDTVRAAAARIATHALDHDLTRVSVVLHGGEPLLLGAARLREVIAELRDRIEPVTVLDLSMQSNGVLMTRRICDLLAENDVSVGISLDGDRAANDRHRRFANGASSHPSVSRALALLREPRYRRVYAGILCTIDVRNDPDRVYEAIVAQEPPRVDFLLPHATWDVPPPRPDDRATPYAEWLLRVHDRWTADGRPMPVRLFESIRATGVGGRSGTEALGLDPVDLAVIETDGTWEQVDSLKITFDGATATGLDVFTHSVDELAARPEISRRRRGLAGLCAGCRACPVVGQCGGGLFSHRYRRHNDFDNPSVYCDDLKLLITTVNARLPGVAPARQAVEPPTENPAGWQRVADPADLQPIELIRDWQLGITRALVAEAGRAHRADPQVDEAWQVLSGLDTTDPAAVASTMRHPFVDQWALDCLSRPRLGLPGYLSTLAVAAAVRARATACLSVPVMRGAVHLPTVGTIRIGRAEGVVRVQVEGDRLTVVERSGQTIEVEPAASAGGRWTPAHRLTLPDHDVLLEETHQFRHQRWRVFDPLPDAESADWHDHLRQAWDEITELLPAHAAQLRAGLGTIAVRRRGRANRPAARRLTFGTVTLDAGTPAQLAETVVCGFATSKVRTLAEVYDLTRPDHPGRLTTGWRPEPLPVLDVLSAAYSRLAFADLCQARATHRGDAGRGARDAGRQREWALAALDAAASSGALTAMGLRFVDQIFRSAGADR